MELHDDACQQIQEFLYKTLRFLLREFSQRSDLEEWWVSFGLILWSNINLHRCRLYIHYPEAQYALTRHHRKRIFPIDQLQTLINKVCRGNFHLFSLIFFSFLTMIKEFGTRHAMDISDLSTTLEHCTKDLLKVNRSKIFFNDFFLLFPSSWRTITFIVWIKMKSRPTISISLSMLIKFIISIQLFILHRIFLTLAFSGYSTFGRWIKYESQ